MGSLEKTPGATVYREAEEVGNVLRFEGERKYLPKRQKHTPPENQFDAILDDLNAEELELLRKEVVARQTRELPLWLQLIH